MAVAVAAFALAPLVAGSVAAIGTAVADSASAIVDKKDKRRQAAAELVLRREKQKQDYQLQKKQIEQQAADGRRRVDELVLQLELTKLDVLMQHPELSDALMKHTKMTYKHVERMQQQGDRRQHEDDEDDTEEDDAYHSGDQSALQRAIGGN